MDNYKVFAEAIMAVIKEDYELEINDLILQSYKR